MRNGPPPKDAKPSRPSPPPPPLRYRASEPTTRPTSVADKREWAKATAEKLIGEPGPREPLWTAVLVVAAILFGFGLFGIIESLWK